MNQNPAQKAEILCEALPYIRQFSGAIFVIKYGGNAMIDDTLKQSFARDISLLKHVGIHPVIIHGGGPQINQMLEKIGKESQFIEGMRVTDQETMQIAEMVLGGQVNKEIVSLINQHGGKAIGLTGRDAELIRAEKHYLKNKIDLGHVGKISAIKENIIKQLLSQGYIPVIAPIGVGEKGEAYNINADLVASAIASALKAEKLIMMTNTSGVLNKQGTLIPKLNPQEIDKLIQDGTLTGGMIPKITATAEASQQGINAVHIIDGRQKNALLLEIFTKDGIGTMIKTEPTTH